MTLRQIETFLAVAREKSFSLGARRLSLSQPTCSEHVRDLEEELGVELFSRVGRKVSLTEAGRVLEEYAARVMSTLTDARRVLGELDGLQRGSLVIGASTTPGIYVLPERIAAFRRRYPGIEVSLRIGNSLAIEERIRANELDFGVVGGHIIRAKERCVAAGLLDELLLIVAPRHPWANRRDISPRELEQTPLLMREQGSATRLVTERALEHAGVKFRTAMELDHIEAIKQAVMAGLGVAFVSAYAIRGEVRTRRLCALRLRGLRVRRHFHVIQNDARTLTASGRAFMALLDGSGAGAPRGQAR